MYFLSFRRSLMTSRFEKQRPRDSRLPSDITRRTSSRDQRSGDHSTASRPHGQLRRDSDTSWNDFRRQGTQTTKTREHPSDFSRSSRQSTFDRELGSQLAPWCPPTSDYFAPSWENDQNVYPRNLEPHQPQSLPPHQLQQQPQYFPSRDHSSPNGFSNPSICGELKVPRSIQLSDVFGPEKLELLYKLVCLQFDPTFQGAGKIDWTRKPFISRGEAILQKILASLPPHEPVAVEPYDPNNHYLYQH